MICSTWRTSSKKLKSHQDGYGPTMAQLSNIVEFRILVKRRRCACKGKYEFVISYTLVYTHTL